MVCETDIKHIYYKTVKEDVSQQIVLDQLLFVSAKYNYLHYCLFIFMKLTLQISQILLWPYELWQSIGPKLMLRLHMCYLQRYHDNATRLYLNNRLINKSANNYLFHQKYFRSDFFNTFTNHINWSFAKLLRLIDHLYCSNLWLLEFWRQKLSSLFLHSNNLSISRM